MLGIVRKQSKFIRIPFIECPTQYQKKYKNTPRMSNNLSDSERLSHEMPNEDIKMP